MTTLRLIKQNDPKHSTNVQETKRLEELNLIEFENRQVKRPLTSREIRESMFDNMNIIRSNKSTNYRFRDNARILRMYMNADARNFDRNFERKVA